MKKINIIVPSLPVIPTRKKVAAYARISEEKGRTMHSLAAQVSFYSEFIQQHSEWEYAGVYADGGLSGTSTDRAEFRRMLADCEAGKIDIILTKSISRFARNTVDLLETVRHLREKGIEVRFEKEHINSLSEDGELMLTLLASFAQEESRSTSENIKWAIKKKFEQGRPNSFCMYGYRWNGEIRGRATRSGNRPSDLRQLSERNIGRADGKAAGRNGSEVLHRAALFQYVHSRHLAE